MISFVRPPISEVSVGIVFSPRADLLIPYIGDFWALIRDQYPHTEHAPLVLGEGDTPVQDRFGNSLPRVWFISDDKNMLVQIQQDRLYVNWRALDSDTTYPRFPAVRNEFERIWSLFTDHVNKLTDSPPLPVRIEISYINFIQGTQIPTTTADISKILKNFEWKDNHKYLPPPLGLALNMTFPLPSHAGNLRVRATTAERITDHARGLHLELQAIVALQAEEQISEAIEEGHQVIIRAFEDLTTTEMQENHWIRGEQ